MVSINKSLRLYSKKGPFIGRVQSAEHFEGCPACLDSFVRFRHVTHTDVEIAHKVGGQVDAGDCCEPVLKFFPSGIKHLHHLLLRFDEVHNRKQRKVSSTSEVCSRVRPLEAYLGPQSGF